MLELAFRNAEDRCLEGFKYRCLKKKKKARETFLDLETANNTKDASIQLCLHRS